MHVPVLNMQERRSGNVSVTFTVLKRNKECTECELLTDSISLLISQIDIDEFKPLLFHEIEALVEYFSRKNHRCTGMKSRFNEEAEQKGSMLQSTRAT